jgi:hypothetical protein
MKINKGKVAQTRRILLYGENGVGKSSLAAQFPNPLFLNVENGIGDLDVDSTDVLKSYSDLLGALVYCQTSDYSTIVIDTIDWAEKLLFQDVAKKNGKETVEDIGFGKGYQRVELSWSNLIDAMTILWKQNRHIILTCHERIAKLKDPEGNETSYWSPDLNDKSSGILSEWCSEVIYLKHKTYTRELDEGPKKRHIAVGGRERVMVCNKLPAIEAKNRLGMPDELPLSIDSWKQFVPRVQLALPETSGNVAGIVTDGSSKPPQFTEPIDSPF